MKKNAASAISVQEQIRLHAACIAQKRIVQKDVAFHYAGIARAMAQLARK